MQVDTHLNWNRHPKQNVITVPTRTILHPLLEVNAITYFHAILKIVCNRMQAKKDLSRHPTCLADSDYN